MLRTMLENKGENFSHNPIRRGYQATYHEDQVNFCPGCGRTHWLIGRVSAECGFCATALPLSEASVRMNDRHTRDNRPVFFQSGTN